MADCGAEILRLLTLLLLFFLTHKDELFLDFPGVVGDEEGDGRCANVDLTFDSQLEVLLVVEFVQNATIVERARV